MTSRLHVPNNITTKAMSSFSTAPTQGMFQSRPFVVQAQSANQVSDLNTSLIRSEKYGHNLNQMHSTSDSDITAVQSKQDNQPVQLARGQKRQSSSSVGNNLIGQPKIRKKKPKLTIDTNPTGKAPHTRRNAAGYKNPSHDHKNMLPLYSPVSPIPPTIKNDKQKKEWLLAPNRRLNTYSPTHTNPPTIVQGHQNTVMGHKPDAAEVWNTGGHKNSRKDNLEHNRQTSSYHGLEDRQKSDASGSQADRYNSPSPTIGSHESYFNVRHPDFDPRNPWTNRFREPDSNGGWKGVKYDSATKDYVPK
ncbi:MAG: hypothetical protein V7L04_11745 [Nostoc sp.]|uniref:hypothetical protein n=1 Tax=Nostoc sp. TaxID=1180 RepID=UPI002FF8E8D7